MKKYKYIILNKLLLALVLTLSINNKINGQSSQIDFFSLTDSFLKKNVDNRGYVAYEDIRAQPNLLDKLYRMIADYSLREKSYNEIKAFYINAYNILAIKQVVNLYPIYGPLAVDGFFDKFTHNVAGEILTLNQIEKNENLNATKDERVHFVIICAAKGCPPLANFAFIPNKIDEQLNERTKYVLNDENFIRTGGKKVEISQIFNWYTDDFRKEGVKGIVDYLNKYREKQIQSKAKTVYYEYNWALNKQ